MPRYSPYIERKTHKELIRKLKDRTQASVIRALNGIERQMGPEAFRVVFKSITADNGSEFLDCEAFEKSVFGGKRTHVYYAHPYSSWERGNNENTNRIIRRFIPKGCDISKFTKKQIQAIADWMNRNLTDCGIQGYSLFVIRLAWRDSAEF